MTPPITAAEKQKRYRERQRQREEEEATRSALVPLTRCVLAFAHAGFTPDRNTQAIARRLWPQDRETLELVNRAATTFATTTTTQWAAELGQHIVSELLISLGPISAGSELLRRATMFSLGRYQSIQVPALVASATNASFIAEGAPVPITQLDTSKSVKLEPRKLATGFVLSREIIQSSNAEALVELVIRNSLALSLDSVLLGSSAGSAAAPPGLLYNITALVPAPAGQAAFVTDMAALAGAVAPIGALDLLFIASPAEAVKISLLAGPKFTYTVLSSSVLPAKTVICVAPVAVVAAVDPSPEITESRNALTELNTAPSDPIMAGAPVRSMFQIDSSAFKVILGVDWGLLNSGAISYVQNVTW
jgi:hypothetical protein